LASFEVESGGEASVGLRVSGKTPGELLNTEDVASEHDVLFCARYLEAQEGKHEVTEVAGEKS
jgi:hypothetical protein